MCDFSRQYGFLKLNATENAKKKELVLKVSVNGLFCVLWPPWENLMIFFFTRQLSIWSVCWCRRKGKRRKAFCWKSRKMGMISTLIRKLTLIRKRTVNSAIFIFYSKTMKKVSTTCCCLWKVNVNIGVCLIFRYHFSYVFLSEILQAERRLLGGFTFSVWPRIGVFPF